MTVPVNPGRIPAIGVYARSPASFQAASAQSARSISSNGGLRTASGAPAARSYSGGGGLPAAADAPTAARSGTGSRAGGGDREDSAVAAVVPLVVAWLVVVAVWVAPPVLAVE